MVAFQLLLPNGEAREIPTSGLSIGRLPENSVQLDVIGVSRRHATVWSEGEQVFIRDEGSVNGTFVNGTPLTPGVAHPLRPGDVIRIESVHLGLAATGNGVAANAAPIMPQAGGAFSQMSASPGANWPTSSSGFGGPPEFDERTTSSLPGGRGRGPLIAALAGLAILLLVAIIGCGVWLANRVHSGLALAGATPSVPRAPTPTGATATPAGVVPMPTAYPWPTATQAAGGGWFGTPGSGGEPFLIWPVPTVAMTAYPAPQLLEPPDGSRFTGPSAVIVLKWSSIGALAPNDYYVVTLNCSTRKSQPEPDRDELLPAHAPAQLTIVIPTLQPLVIPTVPLPQLMPLPTMLPLPTGLPTFTLPITWPIVPGTPLLPGAPIQEWTKNTQWRVPPEIYGQLPGPRECTWWVIVGRFGVALPGGRIVGMAVSKPSPMWKFGWE